jgi:hypothetical protein
VHPLRGRSPYLRHEAFRSSPHHTPCILRKSALLNACCSGLRRGSCQGLRPRPTLSRRSLLSADSSVCLAVTCSGLSTFGADLSSRVSLHTTSQPCSYTRLPSRSIDLEDLDFHLLVSCFHMRTERRASRRHRPTRSQTPPLIFAAEPRTHSRTASHTPDPRGPGKTQTFATDGPDETISPPFPGAHRLPSCQSLHRCGIKRWIAE